MSLDDLEFEPEDGLYWKTRIRMPVWLEFVGSPFPDSDKTREDVEVVFAPEGRDVAPLSLEEIQSVEWLRDNHAAQAEPILQRLLKDYPNLRDEYGYDDDELAKWMPDVHSTDGFKPLISLQSATVHQLAKDGVPYVGYIFDCLWDQEHGIGVLMHGQRVVDFGGADTAILLWIARRDAGKPLS